MSQDRHHSELSQFNCPVNCPNRKTAIGKGYSYLFAIILTTLLAWHSFNIQYSRSEGLKFQSRDVPTGLLIGYLFVVCGALGINTDPLAQWIASTLTKR